MGTRCLSRRGVPFVLALGCVLVGSQVLAQSICYRYTRIADSTGPFSTFQVAGMNDAGTVVVQPMAKAWRFRMASAFSVRDP